MGAKLCLGKMPIFNAAEVLLTGFLSANIDTFRRPMTPLFIVLNATFDSLGRGVFGTASYLNMYWRSSLYPTHRCVRTTEAEFALTAVFHPGSLQKMFIGVAFSFFLAFLTETVEILIILAKWY